MDDIKGLIALLRKNNRKSGWSDIDRLMDEAAEAIKRLEIELAAMRGAANSYKMELDRITHEREGCYCRECYYYLPGNVCGWNSSDGWLPDDFCSYGRRRDDYIYYRKCGTKMDGGKK